MLHIKKEIINGVTIVEPQSHFIDATISSDFKNQLLDEIQSGNSRLVLDLSKVDFIDSSGLGVLLTICKIIGSHNFHIFGLNPRVKSVFELTHLLRLFEFYPNRESALKF